MYIYRSWLSRWLAARTVRVGYWGGEFLCVLISFALTYHGIHVLLIIVVSPSSRRFILCSLVPAPRCFLLPLCAFFCACALSTCPNTEIRRYFATFAKLRAPASNHI